MKRHLPLLLILLGLFWLPPEALRAAPAAEKVSASYSAIGKDQARLTFTFAKPVRYKVTTSGKVVRVIFERSAKLILPAVPKESSRWITKLGTEIENKQLVVGVALADGVALTHKRDGNKIQLNLKAGKQEEAKKDEPKKDDPKAEATKEAVKAAEAKAEEAKPEAPKEAAKPQGAAVGYKETEGGGVELRFPWKERTAASVFSDRGETWVVFAAPQAWDAESIPQGESKPILAASAVATEKFGMLRFRLVPGLHLSTKLDQFTWVVSFTPRLVPLEQRLQVQATVRADQRPQVFVPLLEASDPLTLADPRTAEEFVIVPGYKASYGLRTPRQYVGFRLAASSAGFAMVRESDAVKLTAVRNGLRITGGENMPISQEASLQDPDADSAANAETFFPYESWKLKEGEDAATFERTLWSDIANAPVKDRAKHLLRLAQWKLAEGLFTESLGLLDQIAAKDPEFFKDQKLNVMRGGIQTVLFRVEDADASFSDPEIAELEEVKMWRHVVGVLAGRPNEFFDYIKYEDKYIRKYPPRMRQRLAILAGDFYVSGREHEKARHVFEVLAKDGLLDTISKYADFMRGRIYAEEGKREEAKKQWQPLADNVFDPFFRSRAEFFLVVMELKAGEIDRQKAFDRLNVIRAIWRGDTFELALLKAIGDLGLDLGHYMEAMRAWREIVQQFPNSPDALPAQQKMADTFRALFNQGKADKLKPLEALSLFYEFRDLTPVGEEGDRMIRNLADRLAQVDLLDRAAALLTHQVRYRLEGDEKSKVGARLALIHLLNKDPKSAIDALEISEVDTAPASLKRQRNHLRVQAYIDLHHYDEALQRLEGDDSDEGRNLLLLVHWERKAWRNVIKSGEEMLYHREYDPSPLLPREAGAILRLGLAYVFEKQTEKLKALKTRFVKQMAETPQGPVFAFVTDDFSPVNPENFEEVAKQISTIETFLTAYKEKIDKDRLSNAIP